MRSAPPLATKRPAYITFIREEIAKLGANNFGLLVIRKNSSKRKKQEKDKRELQSQLGSAGMTHSQTNRHKGLCTHQLVLSSPVMSPGRNGNDSVSDNRKSRIYQSGCKWASKVSTNFLCCITYNHKNETEMVQHILIVKISSFESDCCH